MNQRHILRLLAILISVFSARQAAANGFRLADQDAFATARGEAYVATADNPSAVYYNPAGITQLDGLNARAGIYGIYYDPVFRPPSTSANAGHTYRSSENWAAIPQFFTTYTPEDWPVSFGLGVYSPYGGNMEWPQDTGFRAIALKSSLKYFSFNPVVAWQIIPSLSIGAGLKADYAAIELKQGVLSGATPFANVFQFKGCGWSMGYNLGVRWQPLEKLAFGATFRSASPFTLEGHTDFEVRPSIRPGQRPAKTDITFPLTAVLGVSYRPTPKWNFEFDADYTDWSSMGTFYITQTPPPPNPIKQTPIPVTMKWQPSWLYEFGATRFFDNGWHVSAGYVYNENSIPDAYYTPLVPDMDRHFISAGTGYRGKRFNWDVAYQFGYGAPRTVKGAKAPSAAGSFSGHNGNGTYEFISHAIMVTVGVGF